MAGPLLSPYIALGPTISKIISLTELILSNISSVLKCLISLTKELSREIEGVYGVCPVFEYLIQSYNPPGTE